MSEGSDDGQRAAGCGGVPRELRRLAGRADPYYAFVLLMFGTTYYQQRQTQNAQPAGAVDPRQQSPARLMPLMFGVFGFFFPERTGLVLDDLQCAAIGQQYFMLRSRPTAEQLAERARENQKSKKKGCLP